MADDEIVKTKVYVASRANNKCVSTKGADMQYLVQGLFVEENTAGKPQADVISWIEMIVHPSLDMLDKAVQEKKITGGVVAGVREGVFIMDASSNEEVGKFLRSLPFWGALKWTVTPIQSYRSAVEQDKASFQQARAMMAGGRR